MIEGILIGLLAIVLIVLVAFPIIIYHGWALWQLYTWFMVPLGLPELAIAHVIGIQLFLRFLTHKGYKPKEKLSKEESKQVLLAELLIPAAAVFFGYVIKFFM